MQLIDNWLNGSRNFIVGRSLYTTFGNDDGLKKMFAQGCTSYNQKRLVEELELLNKQEVVAVVAKVAVKPLKSIATLDNKGFDDVSKSLEAEWKKYFSELKLWQHKLDEYGSDNSQLVRDACFEICKKIKELERLMLVSIETYDYYKEHKRLPDVKEKKFDIPTNAIELAKFIETCKRQIRRYKKSANPKHQQIMVDYIIKYKLATGKDYE